MISLRKIIRLYLYLSLPVLLMVILLKTLHQLPEGLYTEILVAHLITSSLFFLGHFFNKKGFFKPDKAFLLLVFGGQILRVFLAMLLIFLALNLLKMNQKNFILVFFLFYFLFLGLEIFYITKIKNFRKP